MQNRLHDTLKQCLQLCRLTLSFSEYCIRKRFCNVVSQHVPMHELEIIVMYYHIFTSQSVIYPFVQCKRQPQFDPWLKCPCHVKCLAYIHDSTFPNIVFRRNFSPRLITPTVTQLKYFPPRSKTISLVWRTPGCS